MLEEDVITKNQSIGWLSKKLYYFGVLEYVVMI